MFYKKDEDFGRLEQNLYCTQIRYKDEIDLECNVSTNFWQKLINKWGKVIPRLVQLIIKLFCAPGEEFKKLYDHWYIDVPEIEDAPGLKRVGNPPPPSDMIPTDSKIWQVKYVPSLLYCIDWSWLG